jgi:hypothetical protein
MNECMQSLRCHKKSLVIAQNEDDEGGLARELDCIGCVHGLMGAHSKALDSFKRELAVRSYICQVFSFCSGVGLYDDLDPDRLFPRALSSTQKACQVQRPREISFVACIRAFIMLWFACHPVILSFLSNMSSCICICRSWNDTLMRAWKWREYMAT